MHTYVRMYRTHIRLFYANQKEFMNKKVLKLSSKVKEKKIIQFTLSKTEVHSKRTEMSSNLTVTHTHFGTSSFKYMNFVCLLFDSIFFLISQIIIHTYVYPLLYNRHITEKKGITKLRVFFIFAQPIFQNLMKFE